MYSLIGVWQLKFFSSCNTTCICKYKSYHAIIKPRDISSVCKVFKENVGQVIDQNDDRDKKVELCVDMKKNLDYRQ